MQRILNQLAAGQSLSEADATTAFDHLMSGTASEGQIGAFLMGLRQRGETVEEITAAARVMRAKVLRVEAPPGAIDTCGTGGDAAGTYNISTAAALVIAACGVPVAKHGNRSASSSSGSSDVLAALGVKIDADPSLVRQSLWEANFGFMMAPRHHTAMRHVATVRAELGIRTLFNIIGPLANPAGARRQLMGVYAERLLQPLAEVLGRLGAERAWVVHGSDGLDELTTTGPSQVAEWHLGQVSCFAVTPEDAGLPRARPEDLKGADATHNAAALRRVLAGEAGAYRDIVLLNAGAALVVADHAATLTDGVAQAAQAIDSGKASAVLDQLVQITNRDRVA
jgi:anthranilate phosphoribosyltransferase